MSVYVDYAEYLQSKIDEKNGKYKVYAERNLDSAFDGDVVVTVKSGKYYRTSAEIPYQIDIVSSNPEEALSFFTGLFKELHNTSFTSVVEHDGTTDTYNITQFYQSPAVIDSDIQIGSDHLVRIVSFSSLYITYNVSDVAELKIDNEVIEFENMTISYVIDPHANKRSGNTTVKSRARTNTTSISFAMVNKSSIFCNKLFNIMFHVIDSNTTFTVKITMTNGLTATLTMILSTNALNAAKNMLAGDNIALIEYDSGE